MCYFVIIFFARTGTMRPFYILNTKNPSVCRFGEKICVMLISNVYSQLVRKFTCHYDKLPFVVKPDDCASIVCKQETSNTSPYLVNSVCIEPRILLLAFLSMLCADYDWRSVFRLQVRTILFLKKREILIVI